MRRAFESLGEKSQILIILFVWCFDFVRFGHFNVKRKWLYPLGPTNDLIFEKIFLTSNIRNVWSNTENMYVRLELKQVNSLSTILSLVASQLASFQSTNDFEV